MNTGLFYPRSTVFQFRQSFRRRRAAPHRVLRSIGNSHAMYNRRSTTRTITKFRSSERKPGQFDCYRKLRRWHTQEEGSELALNLTYRIYRGTRRVEHQKRRQHTRQRHLVYFNSLPTTSYRAFVRSIFCVLYRVECMLFEDEYYTIVLRYAF